jgi:hypothetical protein
MTGVNAALIPSESGVNITPRPKRRTSCVIHTLKRSHSRGSGATGSLRRVHASFCTGQTTVEHSNPERWRPATRLTVRRATVYSLSCFALKPSVQHLCDVCTVCTRLTLTNLARIYSVKPAQVTVQPPNATVLPQELESVCYTGRWMVEVCSSTFLSGRGFLVAERPAP